MTFHPVGLCPHGFHQHHLRGHLYLEHEARPVVRAGTVLRSQHPPVHFPGTQAGQV